MRVRERVQSAHKAVLFEVRVHSRGAGRQPRSMAVLGRREPQVRPAKYSDLVHSGCGRLASDGRMRAQMQMSTECAQAVFGRHLEGSSPGALE